MTIRTRIEQGFASLAGTLFDHRWIALPGVLLFAATMLSQLPSMTIDTSTEGLLHDDDPSLLAYNEFRDRFGRDEAVIIAVRPPEVFERAFLERLSQLHTDLENEVPHLDEVSSLINARNTRGEGDRLIVEELLETIPETEAEIAALRERVLANPLYRNLLISADARFTAMIVRTRTHSGDVDIDDALGGFDDAPTAEAGPPAYLTDAENSAVVEAVRAIAKRYDADDFKVSIAGMPVITDSLKRSMLKEIRTFAAMALVTIAILLYLMFRRLSGVLMPLAVVILAVLSTFGVMAWSGTPIKIPTQILPSFLLAVGVGASVHVLAIFYYRLQQGDDKRQAVVHTYGHSGLAIAMTGLTTAAGIGSFAWAEVAPIADLGRFAALGVLISLVYTLLLLPALIAIFPVSTHFKSIDQARTALLDRLLVATADFATGHARAITVAGLLLIAGALVAATSIRFSHNPLEWLPETSPVRQATEQIDHNLRGSMVMEVVIDTGSPGGLYEPAVLQRLDAVQQDLEAYRDGPRFIGKAWSLADVVKEINRALNEDRAEASRVPDSRQLIAQELLLFENSGSDDLENFTDSQFSLARMTLKTPWLDAIFYDDMIRDVEQRLGAALDGIASFHVTGIITLLARTVHAAMRSMAESYVIAAVVITLMMIALVGSVRAGLISMIPNLLPILIALGLMGVTGMQLDLFTMLIGSIAIGLAVDDTIHFFHNFHRYYAESGDPRDATRRTLLSTGRAMLVTTLVLSLGFLVYAFSAMGNLANFGRLTALAIVVALIADFLLAPALLTLLVRRRDGAVVREAD